MERRRKVKKENNFTVLACDPSLTAFGWSVINQNKEIIASGCIKTESNAKKLRIRKGDDRMRRINLINTNLKQILKEHSIQYIVAELPHGSQSAVSAIALGMVAGAVQSMSDYTDIGLEWYSEGDAKVCVLKKRSASKNEMIEAIDKLYKVEWHKAKYVKEAVADSIAIFHVALEQSSVLKFTIK